MRMKDSSAEAVATEAHERLFGARLLREDPPPAPQLGKARSVRWQDQRQVTDLVTPFACSDYPAGGAPSIRSRRSDGATPVPAVALANDWLRKGEAEKALGAPKEAHPGGTSSSNKEAATAAFMARKKSGPMSGGYKG